jgi:hypothetical protein
MSKVELKEGGLSPSGPEAVQVRFCLKPAADGWTVSLSIADAEPLWGAFELDLQRERLLALLARIEGDQVSLDDLKYVGSQLLDGLLGAPALRACRERLHGQGELFHIRLSLPDQVEMQGLPWESLHDLSFFSESMHYCVLRDPPAVIPAATLRRREIEVPKVRILVIVPEGSRLNVEAECQNLEDAARRFGTAVEVCPLGGRVTADRVHDELRRQEYTLVHYLGHGSVDEAGHVRIRFNSDVRANDEQMIDGNAFAALFEDTGVRLVVLNCCLGALPSASSSLSGLGPYLMEKGVPAVLAMRYEIPDRTAIRFSKELYESLFDPATLGRIDLAVQRARRRIFFNRGDGSPRPFITPVLFLAPDWERIFRLPAPLAALPQPQRVAKPRSRIAIPAELSEALRAGQCIPVIGSDLLAVGQLRDKPRPPGAWQLAQEIATAHGYSRMQDFASWNPWSGPLLLSLVCQHYVAEPRRKRRELALDMRRIYGRLDPPPALVSVASWPVPGIICSHFDGLVEDALTQFGKTPRVFNLLDTDQVEPSTDPLVINLRGTVDDLDSLVLTEQEQDRAWDRLASIPTPLIHLLLPKGHKAGTGRSMLFLGISPRDPLVRRLGTKVFDWTQNLGTSYFVCAERDPVEEAYWRRFEALNWIEADAEELIGLLDEAAGGDRR